VEVVAAIIATVLLVAVAGFQLALAAGVPAGAHAYGGRFAQPDGTLPTAQRAASAVAAVVLALAAWVLLARADVVDPGPFGAGFLDLGSWVIAGFLVVNTLGNLASTSMVEKRVFGSVTAVTALLAVVVALS
jgi:hypothetical protein